MSEENNAGGTVETPTVEEMQAKLDKAEAKIVDLKKSSAKEEKTESKKDESTEETFGKDDVEKMIKAALKETAIENQEEQYEGNQRETNSASITTEDPVVTTWFKAISVDEYSALTPTAQREYLKDSMSKTGETQFT